METTGVPQTFSARRLELLSLLGARLNEEVALQPLLDAALAVVLELMGLDAGWIFLLDAKDRYYLAAARGVPLALNTGDHAGLRWGLCYCQRMHDSGQLDQPVNILECERLRRVREALQAESTEAVALQTAGLQYHASIPLRIPGGVLGLMNLARRGDAPLSADELSILTLVGNIVAVAIHRAHLHDVVEAGRLQEREALLQLSQTLVGLVEPATVARAITSAVFRNLKVDGVNLWVPDATGTHLTSISSAGWMEEGAGRRRVALHPPEFGGPAWCAHTRAIVFGDHSDPALPFHVPDEPRNAGVRTCLHIPVVSGERLLGVITVNRLTAVPFNAEEARFLTLAANLTVVALERAHAFQSTKATIEASPIAVVALDLEGRVTEWNPAAERVFGWTRQEVLGRMLATVPQEETEEFRALRERQLAGETLMGIDLLRRRKDGTRFEARLWAAPLYGAGGDVAGSIGFLVDITEHKRAEEIIHRYTEQLERLSRRLLHVHEAERRTIARELHDQTGQMLTALNFLLEVTSRSVDPKRIHEARLLAGEIAHRLPDLSLDLRPALLDDLGLLSALLWHFERFTAQTGIRIDFNHAGVEGQRFGADLETAVYRILQEALTNVARHAGVAEARVRLWADGERVGLQVEDSGAARWRRRRRRGNRSSFFWNILYTNRRIQSGRRCWAAT